MKTRILVAAAASTLSISAVANADTVDMKFTGVGQGSNIKMYFNGNWNDVFAGQLKHDFANGTGIGATLTGNMVTFCADISEHVTSTFKTYTITSVGNLPDSSPMGSARADAIASLYAFANGAQALGTAGNDYACAFQLAIWEILNDYSPTDGLSSLSLTAGDFKAKKTNGDALSGGILSQFNTLMSHINDPVPEGMSMLGLQHATAQDQLIVIPSAGTASLGLIGAACIGRRRRAAR